MIFGQGMLFKDGPQPPQCRDRCSNSVEVKRHLSEYHPYLCLKIKRYYLRRRLAIRLLILASACMTGGVCASIRCRAKRTALVGAHHDHCRRRDKWSPPSGFSRPRGCGIRSGRAVEHAMERGAARRTQSPLPSHRLEVREEFAERVGRRMICDLHPPPASRALRSLRRQSEPIAAVRASSSHARSKTKMALFRICSSSRAPPSRAAGENPLVASRIVEIVQQEVDARVEEVQMPDCVVDLRRRDTPRQNQAAPN